MATCSAFMLSAGVASAITLEFNQRPGSTGSTFTIDGGSATVVNSASCTYDGTSTTSGSGNVTATANGVDLFGDGQTYDVTVTYPVTGTNVAYSASKTRFTVDGGPDTLTFGAATVTIYFAGTQTAPDLAINQFDGYSQTIFGNGGDVSTFSGSGFATFTNTGASAATYALSQDVTLNTPSGSEFLIGQVARFTVNGQSPIDVPASVVATANAASGIDLSWGAVDLATQYSVYRSTTNDFATAQVVANVVGESHTDTVGLVDDLTYYYWVVATNAYGSGPASTSDSAVFQIAAPVAENGFGFEIRGASGRARVIEVEDEMESVLKSREDLHANTTFMMPDGHLFGLETVVPDLMADGRNGFSIITTEEYKNRLTKLDDYIAHKTNRGFRMHVITEQDYDPSGTTTGGQPRAHKIREWLHNNYQDLDLLYVMFIGNPKTDTGDVPMFIARGNIPTDYAYADCSGGTWDLNGDGSYGTNSDLGEGGVDYYPDVYVGRMMIYGDHHEYATVADMDYILQRNIDWENDTGDLSWRQDVICGNVGNVGPYRYSMVQNHATKYTGAKQTWFMGDWGNSIPPLNKTGGDHVVAELNARPYGILHFHGHGTPTSIIGTLATTHVKQITQSKVAGWGYAGGCTIAKPNTEENITWALVRFATMGYCGATLPISNLDGVDDGRVGIAFVDQIYGGQSNGELFWRSRAYNAAYPGGFSETGMNSGNIMMNYYGDPSTVTCPQLRGRPIVLSPNAQVEINHQYGVADKVESFDYHFKNNTDVAANFTSSTTESWLTLTPSSFSLAPNETLTLTASVNFGSAVPAGSNVAHFTINSDQGGAETREVVADHFLPHVVYHESCESVSSAIRNAEGISSVPGMFGTNGFDLSTGGGEGKNFRLDGLRKNFAVSFWVKFDEVADGTIFTKNDSWNIFTEGGKLGFELAQAIYLEDGTRHAFTSVKDTTNVATGQWVHVVANADYANQLISLYVDGAKVGEESLPYDQVGSGYTRPTNISERAGTQIDEVAWIRATLTQDEVDALGRGGFSTIVSPTLNDLSGDAAQTLQWNPQVQAVSYNVYHGSNAAAVKAADTSSAEFVANVTGTSQAVTATAGENFWRVDVVTAAGVNKGFVWNYTYDTSFSNTAPVWATVDIPDWKVGDELPEYYLTDWATDADVDAQLTFELIDGPAEDWYTVASDGSVGSAFGPTAAAVGVNTFTVRVTDQYGASADTTFTINVIN